MIFPRSFRVGQTIFQYFTRNHDHFQLDENKAVFSICNSSFTAFCDVILNSNPEFIAFFAETLSFLDISFFTNRCNSSTSTSHQHIRSEVRLLSDNNRTFLGFRASEPLRNMFPSDGTSTNNRSSIRFPISKGVLFKYGHAFDRSFDAGVRYRENRDPQKSSSRYFETTRLIDATLDAGGHVGNVGLEYVDNEHRCNGFDAAYN